MKIAILLCVSLLLTVVLLNCSSAYFVGLPVFVYSVFPLGSLFLILEMFLYSALLMFALFWGRELRRRRIFYYAFVIGLFFLLNILASRVTKLNLPPLI